MTKLENLNRELAASLESFVQLINSWIKLIDQQFQRDFQLPITQKQYRVLHVLQNGGPFKMSELGELLYTTYGSLTVMIDRLVDKGLVERFFLPDDRRIVMVKITQEGSLCLKKYREKFLEIIVKNMERLTDEDKKRLKSAIDEANTIIKKNNDFLF